MAIAELWELLQADPVDTHVFFPPLTPDELLNLERRLQVRLPGSFVRFLTRSNGARLFGSELLLGFHADQPELDLLAVRTSLRAQANPLPDHLLPFAPADEGVDCFVTNARTADGEYPVTFWIPGKRPADPQYESFDEWLFEFTEGAREQLGMSPGALVQEDLRGE